MNAMPSIAGTYALLLESPTAFRVRAGRLGDLSGSAGCYLYVGSARGPGGLAARVGRHLGSRRMPHWHVDALLERLHVREVWYVTGDERLECLWADAALGLRDASIPWPGFGASDCRCPAHLIRLPRPPSVRAFERQLRDRSGNPLPRLTRLVRSGTAPERNPADRPEKGSRPDATGVAPSSAVTARDPG